MRVLICVAAAVLATVPAASGADEWGKYASENFVIYTASNEGKAVKVLQHLERVRRAYAHMLGVELGGEQPVHVLLFKSQKEYLEYTPIETSSGYYTQALGKDFIVIADFNELVERVLNHEYFHLYCRHQGFQWPTWANEGFADYFSTLKLSDKALDVGYPIEDHMRYLNNSGRKLNAASLFAMGSEERHDAARREVADLYAMSWTLVHLIMSDANLQSRKDQMIAALQTNSDSAMAFQQVYGWDLKEIDTQLAAYARRRTMGYIRMEDVERGELTFDAPVAKAEIAEWEAPLLLADVLANARKFDEAEKEYLRLAELYPESPDVDDSQAQLAMRRNDRDGAQPLLESAIRKGSTNPFTYKFSVMTRCQNSEEPECLDLTARAIALSPDDKQLKFVQIGLLNRSEQFVQALLAANRIGKITSEEAPVFFYQTAYASYRLGRSEDAKKSIEMGLQHAVSPVDRIRLEQLSQAIERPQMTMVPMRAPISDGGPPVLRRPTEGEPTAGGDLTRRRESGPPVESVAQRLVNALTASGATLAEATLQILDCATAPPALVVQTESGVVKILIDEPSSVSIIRDGRIADDYQFTCGPQSGETIRVGYASSTDGSPGVFLRLLQFGDI